MQTTLKILIVSNLGLKTMAMMQANLNKLCIANLEHDTTQDFKFFFKKKNPKYIGKIYFL